MIDTPSPTPPVVVSTPVAIPEPPIVAEAGVTTSEWKALLGFAVQGATLGTADLVNAISQAAFHVSVTIPPTLLTLIVNLEFAGAFVVGSYAVSRAVRKIGTSG